MRRRNELYAEAADDLYSSVRTYLIHARHPSSGVFTYDDENIPDAEDHRVRNLERDGDGRQHFYIPVLLDDLKVALKDYLSDLAIESEPKESTETVPGTRRAFDRGLKLAQPSPVVKNGRVEFIGYLNVEFDPSR